MNEGNIDKTLAETFRLARWPKTEGAPVCPRCHDGAHLVPGYRQHRWLKSSPALNSYYCRCCQYPLSDRSGTFLDRSSRPLLVWAYLNLSGVNEGLFPPGKAHQWKREYLRQMRHRLAGSRLAEAWAARLRQAGITPAQLAPLIQQDKAWWGRPR